MRKSGDRDAALGSAKDIEMDAASVSRDKIPRLFGPFNTGDGLRVVHKILETDIFQFLNGIQAVAVKMIKWDPGFIDMHQNKGRALDLIRVLEAQPFRKSFDEGRLPAPKLPLQT